MSKNGPVALLCISLFALAVPAQAVIGTIDNVPAATMLLPYFEVEIDYADGKTTLFSINNASASAALAHVMIWSDLSVHVFDFMVYLTGYDVVTINLRDILVHGLVPITASDGQDPFDTISPQGPISQDINFASCNNFFPLPEVPQVLVEHMQAALTGEFSPVFGGCAGQRFDDATRTARGYVTVNTMSQCTVNWPGNFPGYFLPGGTGEATNQNLLWGDYFYVHPSQNYAQGDALVHIEADATHPETSVPGEYTFWGRYVDWTAADNREPLATNFAARYLTGGTFSGGTDLIVWRDAKVNQEPFACPAAPGRPPWYPLGQEQIVVFDEQENVFQVPTSGFSPPLEFSLVPFPAEANRTAVGGPDFEVPFQFGWIRLNLNTTVAAAGPNPPEDPAAAQAWVTTVVSADGRFSVGYPATMLDSATNASHLLLPVN